MDHYLLVAPTGGISRLDRPSLIEHAEIRELLGGDFITETWDLLNWTLTRCFNPEPASDANVKFIPKRGYVLIGGSEKGRLSGLRKDEWEPILLQLSAM